MALRLDPLVKGIHKEQMEKKVSRNIVSILSTVQEVSAGLCCDTQKLTHKVYLVCKRLIYGH